jgi:hypothetical protein
MAFLKELFALFLLIVAIVVVKPDIINDLYGNILGRIVLIAIILFFTIHHTTLGLLVALCLIVASNQFFGVNKMRIEGFKEGINGEEEDDEEKKEVDVVSPSINPGAMNPIDSASVSVAKDAFTSTDVAASEGFSSMYSIII